jgi:antibiotic biosynthesis monooxygenase (ABM) superfamily enzyme
MARRPIYFVRMKLRPEQEAAFNAWYDREYLDTLKPIAPLFTSIKRFVTGEGENKEYLTVYEIKDEASIEAALAVWDRPDQADRRKNWKIWEERAVREISAGIYTCTYE